MKRFEMRIGILNKDYVDGLVVALARQGYNVYINEEENLVCFTVTKEDLTELKQ